MNLASAGVKEDQIHAPERCRSLGSALTAFLESPSRPAIAVEPSMSVNKNVSICVATNPGLLIKVAANRTGQKAVGPFIRAAHTSYVRRRYRPGARWMAALLTTERDDGLAVHQLERVAHAADTTDS